MGNSVNKTVDEVIFKKKANESINKMLDCVLTGDGKVCKNCSDVNVCGFLMEAVFAYRQKYMSAFHPAY
jgi:hypothetical protein